MEQKNNLVVSLRCDNSICIRIALELHIILMQWRCPSTNTGSVCVEPRSASSAMMVSYLASRLECVPCRVEYVLPFVDHSLGLPFLVCPDTTVDRSTGCSTALVSSCNAFFLVVLVRNTIFYQSTGTLRLDVNFHKCRCSLDYLHLNTIMYDATIDRIHLHIKLDNISTTPAWAK
jgi:hypothetical protein